MERRGDGEEGRWRGEEMERGGDGERRRWREEEMDVMNTAESHPTEPSPQKGTGLQVATQLEIVA